MDYNIMRMIWTFIGSHKFQVFMYGILTIITTIIQILLPRLYGSVIDCIYKMGNHIISRYIYKLFGFIIILWSVKQFLYALMNYIDSYFIPELESYIRNNYVNNIIKLFSENFEEQEVGQLVSKLIKLPGTIRRMLETFRSSFLPTIVLELFSIAYFYYLHPLLSIALIVCLSIFIICLYLFFNSCTIKSSHTDQLQDDTHEYFSEILQNLFVLYSNNTEETEFNAYKNKESLYKKWFSSTLFCTANYKILYNISYMIMFVLINGASMYLYSKKLLTPVDIISILIISIALIDDLADSSYAINRFFFNLADVKSAQDYFNKIYERINGNINNKNSPAKVFKEMNGLNGGVGYEQPQIRAKDEHIKYENIGIWYNGGNGNTITIHKSFNLIIKRRERIAFVGKSGCGKSTLVNLLLRLKHPNAGNIYVDGINVNDIDINTLRHNINYVPQNIYLFNRSLYENIAYGNDSTKEQVQNLIDKMKLRDFFGGKTIEDKVGKGGDKMSGGQKRMIYLLRCMLKNAPILILDEPTTGLDINSRNQVMRVLEQVMRDKTTILITHDPDLLQYVDRQIHLSK